MRRANRAARGVSCGRWWSWRAAIEYVLRPLWHRGLHRLGVTEMTQLVGSACVKCQKTIPSVVAGEFCSECGNPVHKKCKSGPMDAPNACSSCGSDKNNPLAVAIRNER